MLKGQMQAKTVVVTQKRNDGQVKQVVVREEESSSVGTSVGEGGGVCVFMWEQHRFRDLLELAGCFHLCDPI